MPKGNVTSHGKQRIRKRVGVPSKAADKLADTVYNHGFRKEDTTGKLRDYLTWLYHKNNGSKEIRLYIDKVYLFANGVLVTVLELPPWHRKEVQKLHTKKNKEK
ncbi:MAG: hypothetical protein FWC32_09400 [Firmicutes bacterium]|nr:hypothetical protein [Bacillota bacterium]